MLIPTEGEKVRAADADPGRFGVSVHALQVPLVVLGQRFPGHEVRVLDDDGCGERGSCRAHDLDDSVPIPGCTEVGRKEIGRAEADYSLTTDHAGTAVIGTGLANSRLHRLRIMSIRTQHLPAIGVEALGSVIGKPLLHFAID